MDLSEDVNSQSGVNTWMNRTVNSIVPEIASGDYIAIQVGMIWFNNSGGGSVYTDHFEMSINSVDFTRYIKQKINNLKSLTLKYMIKN